MANQVFMCYSTVITGCVKDLVNVSIFHYSSPEQNMTSLLTHPCDSLDLSEPLKKQPHFIYLFTA